MRGVGKAAGLGARSGLPPLEQETLIWNNGLAISTRCRPKPGLSSLSWPSCTWTQQWLLHLFHTPSPPFTLSSLLQSPLNLWRPPHTTYLFHTSHLPLTFSINPLYFAVTGCVRSTVNRALFLNLAIRWSITPRLLCWSLLCLLTRYSSLIVLLPVNILWSRSHSSNKQAPHPEHDAPSTVLLSAAAQDLLNNSNTSCECDCICVYGMREGKEERYRDTVRHCSLTINHKSSLSKAHLCFVFYLEAHIKYTLYLRLQVNA